MEAPTAALTFQDLILRVAIKAGLAYYGADGTEEAQIPLDVHDLAECKRLVNDGIRMFLNDAPRSGWRWTKPIAELVLWPSIAVDAAVTVTGGAFASGVTPLTASEATFHPSMEGKDIVITGVGTFVMATYTSSTSMTVTGNASAASAATFSIEADGNYTLPRTFGGQYIGVISYAPETNQAVPIEWTNEGRIRRLRENVTVETGWPSLAAVRIRPDRRWELVTYPTPDSEMTVQFPFDLYFDVLTVLTETHPAPFTFDETVVAACIAKWEMQSADGIGPEWAYYRQVCLPASYQADARSAPRRLGYCGDPGTAEINQFNYRDYRQRPNVTFTP